MNINDNEPGAGAPKIRLVQPHGQAALTLVESLIHGLIAKSALTSKEALDIVDTAADVQADYAAEANGSKQAPGTPEVLLACIAASLRIDVDLPISPTRHDTRPRLVDVNDPSFDTSASPLVSPPTHRGIGK